MSEAGAAAAARWPVVSIVVPAHNEQAVIGGNLRRLLAGAAPGEFDVVVVANACADRTADVARRCGVRVVQTPAPGKVGALRLGDAACLTFPRLYLDADVGLTAESVRALVAACARPGVLACAPVPAFDLTGVNAVVRRVHLVHEQLVAPGRALAGAGAYMFTERGHARVFPMPDVISDDGWVHASFALHERVVVREARSLVRPARTLVAHLNRRVRVRRGNRQLAELGRVAPEGRLRLRSLAALVIRGRVGVVDAACYLAVVALDRAMQRIRRGRRDQWGRDLSTRSARAAGD